MEKILESARAGLPPGTITTARDELSTAEWFCYNEQSCTTVACDRSTGFSLPEAPGKYLWGNITGINDSALLRNIGETLSIHSLTLEDIAHPNQRAKYENYETYSYLVLKMLRMDDGCLISEQLSIIFSDDWVISFQEFEGDVFDHIRQRLINGTGRVRRKNHSYLVYALLDAVIDGYYEIIEDLEAALYALEEKMLKSAYEGGEVEVLYDYKDKVRVMHKESRELSTLCGQILSDFADDDLYVYFRDAYDHSMRINSYADELKDLLGSLFNLQSVNLNNALNQTMKVLTIVSTIFIPLTFIAGIYGMNFERIPELKNPNGYFYCLSVMGVVAVMLFSLFKRKKWL